MADLTVGEQSRARRATTVSEHVRHSLEIVRHPSLKSDAKTLNFFSHLSSKILPVVLPVLLSGVKYGY
jgi:hypothetical protein